MSSVSTTFGLTFRLEDDGETYRVPTALAQDESIRNLYIANVIAPKTVSFTYTPDGHYVTYLLSSPTQIDEKLIYGKNLGEAAYREERRHSGKNAWVFVWLGVAGLLLTLVGAWLFGRRPQVELT